MIGRTMEAAPENRQRSDHPIRLEPCRKRVRAIFNATTIADTLDAILLVEHGHAPVYYLPQQDMRMDAVERTRHHTHCPFKGDASYWTLRVGKRVVDNAIWSYEQPLPAMSAIAGRLAPYWDKIDHWFEEDEEIFGHPRDPRHRVDVRPSSRIVRVEYGGECIAQTRRALFVFETDLPTRYYVPAADVRHEFLVLSQHHTTCPYKGHASYWTLRVGDRSAENAIWSYSDPLPECPRIRDYLCFYPEKVDRLDVGGESAPE